MNDADHESLETRVLLLAPTVKDEELTLAILARAGIACVGCRDQVQVLEHLTAGAGALLIPEEAVDGGGGVAEWLARQPTWSDMPVLLLARVGASSAAVAWAMERLGNVTVLERPARVAALVSAVRAALRARQRQYQLREQLVERERFAEQLKMAMAAADAGAWQVNLTTGEFSASERAIALHGLPLGTQPDHEQALACVHPADRTAIQAALRLTFETGTSFRREHRVLQPDGSVHWVSSRAERRGEGDQTCVIGLVQDVTERKRTEQALRWSEARFRAGIEAVSDIVWTNNAEGLMAGEQVAWGQFTGQDRASYEGYGWSRAVHPEDAQSTLDAWSQAVAERKIFAVEHRVRRRDGLWRLCTVRAVPIVDEQGLIREWVGVHTDITDRRRNEEALRDSEVRLAGILRQSPAGIVQTDAAGGMTLVNPYWCEMLGFTETELLGRNILDVTHPASVAPTAEAFGRLAAGGPDFQIENTYSPKDGSLLFAQSNVAAIRSSTGAFLGLIAVVVDISERLRNEEEMRELAAELSEVDRRKDVFLATLAHELRNPLAPLRNGLQLMKLKQNDSNAVDRVRAMMDRQVVQLVRLVDDLLDVSRITQGKVELRREQISLSTVLDAALETSRPAIEQAGLEISVVLPDEPIFVDADATRLVQVVSNLLHNSAKYTRRGGHVHLAARREDGTAVVSVKDSGIGIPLSMIGRVFEMFMQVDRTLEKTTGGLGIGLSLVKGLLELHGGTIEARSDGEGMGSEFIVRLPVALTLLGGTDDPTEQGRESVPSSLCRILVVDDNVDAADSLGQVLEMLGNAVRTANDGEAAIAVAAEFRPDLVLMDIGMPRLNGYEAARRIRQQPWGQAMKLVALTGWGQEDDRKRSADAGFDDHLVKPVQMDNLTKLMSSLKGADAFDAVPGRPAGMRATGERHVRE